MSLLSKKLSAIKPSPTLAVTAKAKELKDQGINIISLAAGEPDFDTPDNIKQAAINAINNGETKYTSVGGTAELKKAICNKLQATNKVTYSPEQVIVSTGGKQVIYNLFMATLDSTDEVIIPTPYWVSYPDMVLLSGGKPVIVEASDKASLKPDIKAIEQAINPHTKWLILNFPNNPSGVALDESELSSIIALMEKHPNLHVMTDDIYEHIIFDDFKFVTLASIAPDNVRERIFIVNGVSKAYSMTGWRIGYGAGDAKLIKAMSVIQSQSTSNPCSISQAAALEALSGTQDFIAPNAKNFMEKRDLVISMLNDVKGIRCPKPQGAFYLFPSCEDLFGLKAPNGKLIENSNDFATYLLEEANVAVVPGVAFGVEGHFRISYATSKDLLQEACKRIKNAVEKLN